MPRPPAGLEQEMMRRQGEGQSALRQRAPEQPVSYKQQMLREPNEAEVQETIDLVTGFAMPVVKMSHLGDVIQGTGTLRPYLRRLVRAANRMPDSGPQDMASRVDVIKFAAGLPSKLEKNWRRVLEPGAMERNAGYYKIADGLNKLRTWAQTLTHMAEGSGSLKRELKVIKK